MKKLNCWEYKMCGREPGGKKTHILGVCPAAINDKLNRINSGKKGGRACWVLRSTLCGGTTQGDFAQKIVGCMSCDFFKLVKKEEGEKFVKSGELLKILAQSYGSRTNPVVSESYIVPAAGVSECRSSECHLG